VKEVKEVKESKRKCKPALLLMTAGVKKVSFSLTKKQKKHCNLLLLVVTFGIVTDTVCW
jgi:hypothetical protein